MLIGNNKSCKIADFGFARDVMASQVYERKSEVIIFGIIINRSDSYFNALLGSASHSMDGN